MKKGASVVLDSSLFIDFIVYVFVCLIAVLTVSSFGLQCVTVVFPFHTYILFRVGPKR